MACHYGASVFGSLKRRMRQTALAPLRSQFDHVDRRLDNLEAALHRDVHGLRAAIEDRAFVVAELVARGKFAELQAISRQHAEQASANAANAAIAAAREHAEEASSSAARTAIAAAREHTEAAAAAAMTQSIAISQEWAEAAVEAAAEKWQQRLSQLRIEMGRTQRALERIDRPDSARLGAGDEGPSPASTRSAEVDDLLYLAIEDRFRGDPAEIRQRQERYVQFLPDVIDESHPLLDLGSGRGEWLAVLADRDVPARGIDSNASCVDECRAAGLRVDLGDLVDVLVESADDSYGAVSMFHVVEHLPFGTLADVMRECARVLVPGGLLIAETPNALNLRVAATNFWLDPTHVRPLHPELLKLLAQRAGFVRSDDLFLNEIGTPLQLPSSGPLETWVQELSGALDGPGDYALLARTAVAASD
jgi:2-polyprenyl-3-methyl-5-hydroxy-6-metoxy-1,4-benzoquinol methylase